MGDNLVSGPEVQPAVAVVDRRAVLRIPAAAQVGYRAEPEGVGLEPEGVELLAKKNKIIWTLEWKRGGKREGKEGNGGGGGRGRKGRGGAAQ